MVYPQEDCIPLRSSTSGMTTWSDLSAPGCLKDSPTPQGPLCVECSMSSDDAAEGFTMKTHWKGKGLLMKVKTRKGKVLVDVPWKFMSNCQVT